MVEEMRKAQMMTSIERINKIEMHVNNLENCRTNKIDAYDFERRAITLLHQFYDLREEMGRKGVRFIASSTANRVEIMLIESYQAIVERNKNE